MRMSDADLKVVVIAWLEGKAIQRKEDHYAWEDVPSKDCGYTPNFAMNGAIWRIKPEGRKFWVGIEKYNDKFGLVFAQSFDEAMNAAKHPDFCNWIIANKEWSTDDAGQSNTEREEFHETMSRMGNTD